MKRFLLLPLGLAAILASSGTGRALDLTPHFVSRVTAARTEQIPYFVEGETKYSLLLPAETTASGEPGEVTFCFGKLEGASLVIKPSPFQPALAFSGPALETYRKALPQFLPPKAEEIAVQSEQPYPLPINGWSGQSFTLAYKLPGRAFLQSVTFLNFSAHQQIVLIVTAPSAQFEQASALSLRMMRSWRSLLPGENLAVPPQL